MLSEKHSNYFFNSDTSNLLCDSGSTKTVVTFCITTAYNLRILLPLLRFNNLTIPNYRKHSCSKSLKVNC